MIATSRLPVILFLCISLPLNVQLLVYGQATNCTSTTLGVYDTRRNGLGGVCVAINTSIPICYGMNNSIWETVACRSQGYIGVNTTSTIEMSNQTEELTNKRKITFSSCPENEINLLKCNYTRSDRNFNCNGVRDLICQECTNDNNCTDNNINSVCRNGRCGCQRECNNGGYCYNNMCRCPEEYTGNACEINVKERNKRINNNNNSRIIGPIVGSVLLLLIIVIMAICCSITCCYHKSRIKKLEQNNNNNNIYENNNKEDNYQEDFYAMVKIEHIRIEAKPSISPIKNKPSPTANINEENVNTEDMHLELSNIYHKSGTIQYPITSPLNITTNLNTTTTTMNNNSSIINAENDEHITIENELYGILEPNTLQVKQQYIHFYGVYNTIHGVGINDIEYSALPVQRRMVQKSNSTHEITSELKDQSTTQGGSYFKKESIYWQPHYNINEIFNQMAESDFREIGQNSIILENSIGSGEFGKVYMAKWSVSAYTDEILPVAVKIIKYDSTQALQTAFMKEAAIMGQFDHPNIIKLLGVVSQSQPYMIVTELMETQLLQFISSAIKNLPTIKTSKVQRHVSAILLKFTREIACGMRYLSSKQFIHRDLAARNILIGKDLVCRISDFGMSRELRQDSDYYKSQGGIIPVRWCSPEAVFYKRYSEKSDVWSYGMTLYEMWTLGKKPWHSYSSNEEVMRAIETKEILPPPAGCPRAIYSIMVDTWNPISEARVDFEYLVNALSGDEAELLQNNNPNTTTDDANTGGNEEECYLLGGDPNTALSMYRDVQLIYSIP